MTKFTSCHKCWLFVYLLLLTGNAFTQETDSEDNWDNQLYLANKLTWGKDRWKYSGELQIRLENNMQSLEKWYMEGVASFMPSKNIEIAPDFRLSIKTDDYVFRPGLGVLFKSYVNDFQFVNQVKWQIDMHTIDGRRDNALRYVLVINKQLKNKLIASFLAGALYRWSDDFRGPEIIRAGPGLTYIFNSKQSLYINYYLSAVNNHQTWEWSGIPFFQLIIHIDKEYKYLPAVDFNF